MVDHWLKHRYHMIPTAFHCLLTNLPSSNYNTEINKTIILDLTDNLKLYIHNHNDCFKEERSFYSAAFYKPCTCIVTLLKKISSSSSFSSYRLSSVLGWNLLPKHLKVAESQSFMYQVCFWKLYTLNYLVLGCCNDPCWWKTVILCAVRRPQPEFVLQSSITRICGLMCVLINPSIRAL